MFPSPRKRRSSQHSHHLRGRCHRSVGLLHWDHSWSSSSSAGPTASSRVHPDAAGVSTLPYTTSVSVRAAWDKNAPARTLSRYVRWAVSSATVWRVHKWEEHSCGGKSDSPCFPVKPFIPRAAPSTVRQFISYDSVAIVYAQIIRFGSHCVCAGD
jgi:hypothetical protein